MKTVKLGDYLKWNGKLAQVVGETDKRVIFIRMEHHECCPHCAGALDQRYFGVIPDSPLFQENAEPLNTISNG